MRQAQSDEKNGEPFGSTNIPQLVTDLKEPTEYYIELFIMKLAESICVPSFSVVLLFILINTC